MRSSYGRRCYASRAVLAISTRCVPVDRSLDRAAAALRALGLDAIALHRPAEADEARALASARRGLRIVAVFGETTGGDFGRPLLVVEGGPALEVREASLDALCRRLHALRGLPVAVRTPEGAGGHPAPHEIALLAETVRGVGYFHDAARGGDAYLDAAGPLLRGACFDPLVLADAAGLREALPGGAPAVIDCEPGRPKDEVAEAIACARGWFRA